MGRAPFLYSGQLFRTGTLDGGALTSNSFLVRCPTKPASLAPFPCLNLAASSTWSLRGDHSARCAHMPLALPLKSEFETRVSLMGDRGFGSHRVGDMERSMWCCGKPLSYSRLSNDAGADTDPRPMLQCASIFSMNQGRTSCIGISQS